MNHEDKYSNGNTNPQSEHVFSDLKKTKRLTLAQVDTYNSTNLGELYTLGGPVVTDARLRALKKKQHAAVVDPATGAVIADIPWPERSADELRDNERYGFGPGEGRRRQ